MAARTHQRAGELRERVRIERRRDLGSAGDGGGNYEGAWDTLIAQRAARIAPVKGGEVILAGRLQGVRAFDVWVRADSATRGICEGDRLVDRRDPNRTFDIKFVGNLDEVDRFILLQCTSGGADG